MKKKMTKKLVGLVGGTIPEGIALLVTRIALAGIFWRSARTKVEEGSILTIKDTTFYQFSDVPFNQVPIFNGELGAYVTTYMEHLLPVLLVLGLATRFGALGIFVMTMVIQIFVFPEMIIWWQTHILWVAMALILIVRGGGIFSLDRLTGHKLG
ncbi:DoxX family protein [Parasphingorhabdus flavimaris]|uniref:DoxX family protein n=1 Tax=Parasphingorhabdus flavimaris TaxID=266812 RepID=UPI003001DC9A